MKMTAHDYKSALEWVKRLRASHQPYVPQIPEYDAAEHALQLAIDGGWMPIESAPRDGKAILVYCPNKRIYGETGNVIRTCWQRHATHDPDNSYGWVGLYDINDTPTHWMPLPQPPEESE